MFRPSWTSSSNEFYVQSTWEDINSTGSYKRKGDLIFTTMVVIDSVILYIKHAGIVIIGVLTVLLLICGYIVWRVLQRCIVFLLKKKNVGITVVCL
jgi:hypothetical protein